MPLMRYWWVKERVWAGSVMEKRSDTAREQHSGHAASDPDCPIETIPSNPPSARHGNPGLLSRAGEMVPSELSARKGSLPRSTKAVRWVTDPSAAKTQL